MARLVKKFGGTSLGDVSRMIRAGERVAEAVSSGHQVCVVVSAMGGETNRLTGLAEAAGPARDAAEMDALLATGEQASAALFAMILQNLGLSARSWQAWQVAIETDAVHGSAKIKKIQTDTLLQAMTQSSVPVVTGFQGLSPEARLTTLGRGGSDTTAMALADALDADRCDIYTDVPGVFTADPRHVPDARRIDQLSYAEMDTLACFGAKVMHAGSVAYAQRRGLDLRILSSFEAHKGTTVTQGPPAGPSPGPVKAIASMSHCQAAPDSIQHDGVSPISVAMGAFEGADNGALQVYAARDRQAAGNFPHTLLTLVGDALEEKGEIAGRVAALLRGAGIDLKGWQKGQNYLSLLVPGQASAAALRILHEEFGLAGQG